MLAPSNRPKSRRYGTVSARRRHGVGTTCVSGWVRHSTYADRVIDPSAYADGTDLTAHRADLRPSISDLCCSGRARLSTLTVLLALSVLALSGFALVRTRAESSSINTLSPWERDGVRVRSMR